MTPCHMDAARPGVESCVLIQWPACRGHSDLKAQSLLLIQDNQEKNYRIHQGPRAHACCASLLCNCYAKLGFS